MSAIGVDIGGTFTDVVVMRDDGSLRSTKAPTTPGRVLDGLLAALREAATLEGVDLDTALELALKAVEQLPERGEIHDTVGWVYMKKGLPMLSVRPFEQAVQKDPRNASYHHHLGMAYAKVGEPVRARQSLQTALKLDPSLDDAKTLLSSLDGK